VIFLGRTKKPSRKKEQEFPLVQRYQKLRKKGEPPKQAWAKLKEEYKKWLKNKKPGKNSEQSWKSASGKAFEDIVWQEFSSQCQGLKKKLKKKKNLQVAQWYALPDSLREPLSERLWVRGEIQSVTVESNVDFVAYEIDNDNAPKRIIAVYSCKVSLRERFQQDLFWADRLRGRGIRFCLITLDNDGVLTKAATTGVLTSKQASMSVAAYDRIYLFCNKSEIQIQCYTRVFRTVDCLGEDLKRWLELD
jgi:hypothetical protein